MAKDSNHTDFTKTKKRKSPADEHDRCLPFKLGVIQEMLLAAGHHATSLTNEQFLTVEGKWKVQGSNDCLLFITEEDSGEFSVHYHCTAGGCCSQPKTLIGTVQYVPKLGWQHAMASRLGPEDEPVPVNHEQDLYPLVKARHELGCFLVRNPFTYAHIESGGEIALHSQGSIRHYLIDKKYSEMNAQGKWERKKFITRWIKDEAKRTVDKVVLDPRSTPTTDDVYNMWRPFKALSLPPVDDECVSSLIAPIVKHLHEVVARENEDITEWFFDYMANLVQRPEMPTKVALLLHGHMDCGNGIIFDFLRKCVLGGHCSSQTAELEHENNFVHTVLCQVNGVGCINKLRKEVEYGYAKKCKGRINVPNLVNFVITTNNDNVFAIRPDEPRFALFHCSDKYRTDKAYKGKLGEHLKRPEVARALYQHLMARDLSAYPFSFQDSRPH